MKKTVNADVYSYQGIKMLNIDGVDQYLYFFVKKVAGQVPEYVFYPECKYVSDKNKTSTYFSPINIDKVKNRDNLNLLLTYSEKFYK